jgi:hypothetical protein
LTTDTGTQNVQDCAAKISSLNGKPANQQELCIQNHLWDNTSSQGHVFLRKETSLQEIRTELQKSNSFF